MNGLTRKMCILKQQQAGFSMDGTPVGGVARIETYGGVLTLQLSLINFATLSEGRYVCILCDKAGERIVFPLTNGVTTYKTERTLFDPSKGFCCMVCFLHLKAVCVAMGQFGGGTYSSKLLMDGLAQEKGTPAKSVQEVTPPSLSKPERKVIFEKPNKEQVPPMPEAKPSLGGRWHEVPDEGQVPPMSEVESNNTQHVAPMPENYNDEAIIDENYFDPGYAEKDRAGSAVTDTENAKIDSASEWDGAQGIKIDGHEDDTLEELFRPLTREAGQSYYLQVKEELEGLFATGKRSLALTNSIPNSEWVQIDENNGCLVGLIYEELSVRYIAYALPAKGKGLPQGMEKACFVPADPVAAQEGYFVLFQDAATGETVQAFNA